MSGNQGQLRTLARLPATACLQRLLLAAPLLVALATPAAAQEPSGKAWNDLATAETSWPAAPVSPAAPQARQCAPAPLATVQPAAAATRSAHPSPRGSVC